MPATGSGSEICHGIATRRVAVCALGEKNKVSCVQISLMVAEVVSPGGRVEFADVEVEGRVVSVKIRGK